MATEIANLSYIENELKKFNVTEQVIADIREKYLPLKIDGVDDKDGYAAVKKARLDVRSLRTGVEKKRAELNKDAIKFQRLINAKAKLIKEQLEPIEGYLEAQENEHEAEIERIEKAKEEAAQAAFLERIQMLTSVGMAYNGRNYELVTIDSVDHDTDQVNYTTLSLESSFIKVATEAVFYRQYERVKAAHEKGLAFKAEIEQKEKAEQDRIAKERAEKEAAEAAARKAENERLQQESIRLAQERKEIEEEKAKIAAMKKEHEDKLAATVVDQKPLAAEPEKPKETRDVVPIKFQSPVTRVANKPEEIIFKTDIRSKQTADQIAIKLLRENNRWCVEAYYYKEALSPEHLRHIGYIDIDLLDIINWVKKFKPELLKGDA